jgi:transketolase
MSVSPTGDCCAVTKTIEGRMTINWISKVENAAHQIRKRVLGLTIERNGCYLSQALSSADILSTLYLHTLNLGPSIVSTTPPNFTDPPSKGGGMPSGFGGRYNGEKSESSDRLIISPAHYAVVIYAALVEAGRLSADAFSTFSIDGSTMEMIGAEHSPGFEMSTGSFGQALSQAGGVALARRLRGHTGRVVVFMSDGEFEEGQTWEAVQCLAHYSLNNLTVVVDVNGQQVDGLTKDVMNIEPLSEKLTGFGAEVKTVNGHEPQSIHSAFEDFRKANKPQVLLCYTDSAHAMPMLEERKPFLHYVKPRSDTELKTFQTFHASM